MKQYPGFASQRTCQMRNHRVDADEQIQLFQSGSKHFDIGRAGVDRAYLSDGASCWAELERIQLDAIHIELLEQGTRDAATLVPVSDFPHQPDRKTGGNSLHG